MFTQVEVLHIGFNMLALWVLGPQLELVLGRLRYPALYLLSGLVGSAVVYWLSGQYHADAGRLGRDLRPDGRPAGVGLQGARRHAAAAGLDRHQRRPHVLRPPTISWQGHLGGFVGGVVLAVILAYAPRRHRRTAWQARRLRRRSRAGGRSPSSRGPPSHLTVVPVGIDLGELHGCILHR